MNHAQQAPTPPVNYDEMTSCEVAESLALALAPTDRHDRYLIRRGVRTLLGAIEDQPGTTWQHRWYAADGDAMLRASVCAPPASTEPQTREGRNRGLRALVSAQIIRPGISSTAIAKVIGIVVDPVQEMHAEDFQAAIDAASSVTKLSYRSARILRLALAAMVLFTGKPLRDIRPSEWVSAERLRIEVVDDWGNRGKRRRQAKESGEAVIKGRTGLSETITLHIAYGACVQAHLMAPEPEPEPGKPPIPMTLRLAKAEPFSIDNALSRYGNSIPPNVRAMLHHVFTIEWAAYDRSTIKGNIIRLNTVLRAIQHFEPDHDSLKVDHALAARVLQHLQDSDALARPAGTKRTDIAGTLSSAKSVWSLCRETVTRHRLTQYEPLLPVDFPWSRATLRQLSKNERQRRNARLEAEVRRQINHLDPLVAAAQEALTDADAIAKLAHDTAPGDPFTYRGTTYLRSRVNKVPVGTGRSTVTICFQEIHRYWDVDEAAFHAARSHLAITILRETGVRIEELVELTINDFQHMPDGDLQIPVLHVRPSKMDRARNVGFAPQVLDVLLAFVRRTNQHYGHFPLSPRLDDLEQVQQAPRPLLFFQYRHQTFTGVEPEVVRTWLNRVAKNYDLNINLSAIKVGRLKPHGVRRAFATDLHDRGATLVAIQNQLGHANLQTTQIYIKADERQSIASAVSALNTRKPGRTQRPGPNEAGSDVDDQS